MRTGGNAARHTAAHHAMDNAMAKISVNFKFFRRWAAGLAFAAAIAVPATASAQVVVVANGAPITAYDIEQRIKLDAASTHKAPARQDVIKELIDDRIKIAKAKGYGLEVSDKEVDAAYDNMAKAPAPDAGTVRPAAGARRRRAEHAQGAHPRRADLGPTGPRQVRRLAAGRRHRRHARRCKPATKRKPTRSAIIYTLYPIIVVVPPGSSPAVIDGKKREAEACAAASSRARKACSSRARCATSRCASPITKSSADLAPALARAPRQHRGRPADRAGSDAAGPADVRGLRQEGNQDRLADQDASARGAVRQAVRKPRPRQYLEEMRKQAMIEYK